MKKFEKVIISSLCGITLIGAIGLGVYSNNKKNNNGDLNQNNISNYEVAESTNNIKNINNKNIVLDLKSSLDYALDVTDKNVRKNNADYVIIGKIKSIDGSTNYNGKQNIYTSIFTYGQIEIETILKGNISDSEIPFIRLGGDIQFSEYEKGLTTSQKEKMELVNTLSRDEKENSYVSYSPEGDIKLEEGKTYLMYMNYNTDYEKYICTYMQYGTREIDTNTLNNGIQTASNEANETEIKVKNNDTGEWENLSDVF